jgi:hypothetical protein
MCANLETISKKLRKASALRKTISTAAADETSSAGKSLSKRRGRPRLARTRNQTAEAAE